jgi:hypothetical protein
VWFIVLNNFARNTFVSDTVVASHTRDASKNAVNFSIKFPLIFSDINRSWKVATNFLEKAWSIKCHENHFSWPHGVTCDETRGEKEQRVGVSGWVFKIFRRMV